MVRLKYEKYNGSDNIITIDLQNGYTIIAIKSITDRNEELNTYLVELRLKENTTDDWKLIEKAETLEFNATAQIINSAILKQVSTFLNEGFFDYYIKRYEYEMKCFDKGNEFYEKGRKCDKSCLSCDYWKDWDDCK